jgi:hypothetical protein
MTDEEINNMLKDIFYEPWMDDSDWQEFLIALNIDYDQIRIQLQIGVDNGYDIATQLGVLKKAFMA